MLFSSITFLYYFLPIILLLYFVCPQRYKILLLLGVSLVFYYLGDSRFVLLLIVSTVFAYLIGWYIHANAGKKMAKVGLVVSIIIQVGLLVFFKYWDFFMTSISGIFKLEVPLFGLPLPIGISFYTFQTLSYTIDVYRGQAKPEKDLITFATYVCLFPQLVAGPIVRYVDIEQELKQNVFVFKKLSYGLGRFVIGLAKKVIVANSMGSLCLYLQKSNEATLLSYWLYGLAFTLQIYYDFSGYSDMAIGLGAMFGFTFPENFNYPYMSKSITEFWRRWHMTLGTWFRDYVYIPLGGNRVSKGRWLLNLLIVWMLTGLWHGAAWNFVIWGLFFGVLLCLEKLGLEKLIQNVPRVFQHLYVCLLVILSFVIFDASSLGQMFQYAKGMFGFGISSLIGKVDLYYFKSFFILILVGILGATTFPKQVIRHMEEREVLKKFLPYLEVVFFVLLLVLSTAHLVDESFQPFLYFRF